MTPPVRLISITPDEAALRALGAALAQACPPGITLFLQGQLGAGKTTLVRGFLHGLGYSDRVKSPTYTLVEPYSIHGQEIFHFDLYRLDHPELLEEIGIRDYFTPTAICLIEWPERGATKLPPPDLVCQLEFHPAGRQVHLTAFTAKGQDVLAQIAKQPLFAAKKS